MTRKKKKPVKTKTTQRYHPKVMENLMRMALEEDQRRDMMSEMDRAARQHLSDL